MSTERPRYRPSSQAGATPATRVNTVDAQWLAADVRAGAKLDLPHPMADDDPFVQREMQEIGELGRHRGNSHDRRVFAQRDAGLRLARGAEPLECVEATFQRQIALVREGAGRVLA